MPPPPQGSPDAKKSRLQTSSSPEALAAISGNASIQVKADVVKWFDRISPDTEGFALPVQQRVSIVEISVNPNTDEPQKLEGRVVCEMDVKEDMLNGAGNLHGGCSCFLIDVCSSLALTALGIFQGTNGHSGVSQSIHTTFHSPASLGDKLRIVNTTLTRGKRIMSVRTEIWNATHHRLVTSGIHAKMMPSAPKAKI